MWFKHKDSTGLEHEIRISVSGDGKWVHIYRKVKTSGNSEGMLLPYDQAEYIRNRLNAILGDRQQ